MGKDQSKLLKQDIETLKDRLEDIDRNKDGVVTKEEFSKWKKNQQIVMNTTLDEQYKQHQKEMLEYQNNLKTLEENNKELVKQVDTLKKINKMLEHQKMTVNVGNNNMIHTRAAVNMISEEKINEFVEELIQDESINVSYMPDYVERQLYRNIFNILINVINRTTETMSVNFLGHKLTMHIENDNDIVKNI